MTFEDDELLREFVIESKEHLASVETQLLELESQHGEVDVAKVNNVFRAIHSIKGVAGFLNLKTLESLAHREEEVLNRLRNKEVRPTGHVINTLLRSSDCIKWLLDSITTSNEKDVSEHIIALENLLKSDDGAPNAGAPASSDSRPTQTLSSETARTQDADANATAGNESVGTLHHPHSMNDNGSSSSPSPGSGRGPKQVNPEVIRDFLIESHDSLEQLELALVALEKSPEDCDLLNAIFRTIHTLKGSSGFLSFTNLETLAHAAENLLSDLRAGDCEFDTDISAALFASVDLVRKHLQSIENDHCEGDFQVASIVNQLHSLQRSKNTKGRPISRKDASEPQHSKGELGGSTAIPNSQTNNSETNRQPRCGTDAAALSSAAESTIRVDVALLDKLMTRVGELVLARNQILQFAGLFGETELQNASQHLNLITTELQEGVMKTRMQPIGTVWSKFPRLVRDLATTCGKSVRIEMEGKETELDKTIIEAIKDPLTHLVRNNVDHGIEKPEDRVARGKPAEGCLMLRAYHEGGQVNIEISDDGGGLNLKRIKAKAVDKGIITGDQASRLTDHETAQLIFLPGFSTAEKVSNVSGRGVGMDVVRTNIEKIGGTVDLQSVEGVGTSVKIKIPLTLAIIPALIITNNGNRFAIPQVNLLELVRLEVTDSESAIEWVQSSPVYRLRGRLLPLVFLSQVLTPGSTPDMNRDAINIVVLRVDDRQFGLVVDRINDTEEIVVKPMGKQLKGVPVFAGATIMGDGKVALILDVQGIAQESQLLSKDRNRMNLDCDSASKESGRSLQTLLILGTGTNRRLALPISQVSRLEKIPITSLEYTDQQEVVQYRGTILPLIRLSTVFGIEEAESNDQELLNVVVYNENDQSYGLVVDRVIDIVETHAEITHASNRRGLLGSAIIQKHVTDLVDLPSVFRAMNERVREPFALTT